MPLARWPARPLHCRLPISSQLQAWLVAGVRYDGRTGHPTLVSYPSAVSFDYIYFRRNGEGFDRAPIAFPPRAGATNTLPIHQQSPRHETSSPPRAAIVHLRSPVSRLQLPNRRVYPQQPCAKAKVRQPSSTCTLPCTETNTEYYYYSSKLTCSNAQQMNKYQFRPSK
jgi:hypothetical protein